MKKPVFLYAPLLLAVLLPGCASWTRGEKAPVAAAVVPVEERPGAKLLKSFISNDAKGFLKLLPPDVANEFGKTGFQKTRESMIDQLGTPVAYEYVMELQHPRFQISIWKIRYERKSSDGKKILVQETLFRTVCGKIDGRDTLLAFNFF